MNTIIFKIMMLNEQIKAFRKEENGATFVEYAVLISLVAVVASGGVLLMGNKLSAMFTAWAGALSAAVGSI